MKPRMGWVGLVVLIVCCCVALAQDYPAARVGGNYMRNFYLPPAPGSTPWDPAWSPDGRWIAFGMSGSIWKVDPETGIAWELTYDGKYHSSPDWSPDGGWIVYTADDGGNSIQLQILDVGTGRSHTLTDDSEVYAEPSFSPDGRFLAYVASKPAGRFNVFVRPIRDGQWAGDEIAVTSDHDFGRDRLYFGRWDIHINPAWMKSSQELLLVSNRGVPLGSGNLIRVPARENGIDTAQTVVQEQTLYRAAPDVSPDGKRFVYSSTRGAAEQYNNLYVQPTQGGEPYKLTFFEHDAFCPRWSPDGEWIAYIDNRDGLPQLRLLETYGGEERPVDIIDRRWKRPMGRLRVRILSGRETTAARIHLTASDGKFYAPADAYARVSAAGDHLFHTPGEFDLELPVGPVRLTAVKGFEHEPAVVEIPVKPSEVTFAEIPLQRFADMAAKGWFSGSTHVHMNYGGNLHNTLENLLMMSAAEDQDVVNEQVANKDNRVLDYQYFIPGGRPHPLSTPDRLLVVGQEYRPPFYGHVFMLGLTKHLISPFTTGYEGTAIESLYPSNTDMLRKAKAQGATVGYVHAFAGESDPLEGDLGGGKGYMVDAALGATDALEWSASGRASFFPWYATLDNGLHVAAVGGEDSISDLHRSKLVGSVRTYVFTGTRGLDMDAWFSGLRRGNSFVTTGPLVELTVNDRIPGEQVEMEVAGNVDVRATVRSMTRLGRAFLVFNGEPLAEIPLTGEGKRADFEGSFPIADSGWLHLRVEGDPADRFPLDCGYAMAFTNPVWIEVGGHPVRNRSAAVYSLAWIDKLKEMALAWPGWRSERETESVLKQFEEARRIYEKLQLEAGN